MSLRTRVGTCVQVALVAVVPLLFAAPGFSQSGVVPSSPALYFQRVGRSGPLVVVLHGGPGASHDYLRPAWDRLAERARLIYYDQRGCGRSAAAPAYRWQEHVADLARLLRHLAPEEPVILAGSSWGSMLALLYTLERPDRVRALILAGVPPWPRRSPPPGLAGSAVDLAKLPPHARARIDSVLKGLPVGPLPTGSDTSRPITPRDRRDLYGLTPEQAEAVGNVCDDVYRATTRSLQTVPPLEAFEALRVPALIVHGTGAGIPDGSEELSEVLPLARREVLQGAGHDPWLTQPERFFALVRNFLERLEDSRDGGGGSGETVRGRSRRPEP